MFKITHFRLFPRSTWVVVFFMS